MTTNQAEQTPIERLKAGIWDIHEGVTSGESDESEGQENLADGTLPKEKYIAQLGQRYLIQKGFEEILARHYKENPFLAAVVTDEQFHADKAAQDLKFFGVDPDSVQPTNATRELLAFAEAKEKEDPRLLLAVHYVIEGSNNGAFMIAKNVKKAYNLEGTDGTYHLQPYGPKIREKWGAFREAFNTLDIDDALMEKLVQTGRDMFHHMNRMGKEARQSVENA